MNKIEIKNLFKSYGNLLAVDNLSMNIETGTIHGFIGPNGAGKSTTIRCLLNLLNRDSGSILIDGVEMPPITKALKSKIGYLPAEIHLYSDLTVDKLFKYNEQFYDNFNHQRLDNLVKLLDLDTSKVIRQLSLGNQKKVGLILALAHEPEILILDEPTSGLDPLMQKVFFDILLDEKKRGTTILLSTHVLSEVKKICDYVTIIKQGVIIKTDTVANIIGTNTVIIKITTSDIECLKEELKTEKIIEQDEHHISFIYNDNVKNLLSIFEKINIDKLLIEEPSIEEIFMHYYQ